MSERWEAVVVGTGFGGAVAACRLSKRWPNKVLVLERGKRYPMFSFPRSPREMSQSIWNVRERSSRPHKLRQKKDQHGLSDIRNFSGIDAVLAAGLGGGSLIYANVFMEPPEHVLADPRWPSTCRKADLDRFVKKFWPHPDRRFWPHPAVKGPRQG